MGDVANTAKFREIGNLANVRRDWRSITSWRQGAVLVSTGTASPAHDGGVLSGDVADPCEVALRNGGRVYQGAADTQAVGTRFEEALGRRQVDAAGRHQTGSAVGDHAVL